MRLSKVIFCTFEVAIVGIIVGPRDGLKVSVWTGGLVVAGYCVGYKVGILVDAAV